MAPEVEALRKALRASVSRLLDAPCPKTSMLQEAAASGVSAVEAEAFSAGAVAFELASRQRFACHKHLVDVSPLVCPEVLQAVMLCSCCWIEAGTAELVGRLCEGNAILHEL